MIDTARATEVATHFMPWDANGSMEPVLAWIRDGSIGTLREVHNWTNRPVWPQYPTMPTDTPPIPDGLRLGPVAGPGGGAPLSSRTTRTWCSADGTTSAAAPWRTWATTACGRCSMRWSWTPRHASSRCSPTIACSKTASRSSSKTTSRSPSQVRSGSSSRRAGSARRWTCSGTRAACGRQRRRSWTRISKELPAEGMMFVGDKGKILAGFHVDGPRLIPEKRMKGGGGRDRRRGGSRGQAEALAGHAAMDRGVPRRSSSRPAAS